jgi:putative tryptophan/tyrosine transport system substrate-binding protein
MRRREFITLLAGTATAWPLTALAQQPTRPARIGLLAFGQQRASPLFDAFREEMRRLGHVEGGTYVLEFRSAYGDPDRLQNVAAELVRLPVDVILTDSGSASIAAKHATAVIPVVMAVVSDPVGIGLVSSLARPGGNVTGFSILSPQLGTKRLALLKEAVPDAKLVGVLLNPASPVTGAQQLAPIKDAAAALGVELVVGEARDPDSISAAIDSLVASRVSALMVVGDATFFTQRKLIVDRAAANRLPGIYPEREYAEAGGLITYGPSVPDNFRRAAGYVVRILRGEKPGDLPVEQPAKFELVINLKTATAIGIAIPPAFPLRADEVIE